MKVGQVIQMAWTNEKYTLNRIETIREKSRRTKIIYHFTPHKDNPGRLPFGITVDEFERMRKREVVTTVD